MRILIASQYYHPAYDLGGTVAQAVAQAEGLARLGHDVEVVASSAVNLKSRFVWRDRVEVVNGVNVHYLGAWFRVSKIQFVPALVNWARTELSRFDVLYQVGYYDLFGPILTRHARKKNVPYGLAPCGMLNHGNRRAIHKWLYHVLVGRKVLAGARSVIFNSALEMEQACGFGVDLAKSVIIPNGINLPGSEIRPGNGTLRSRLDAKLGDKVIVWLGRIDPIKNLETLISALAEVTDLAWRLAIVGPKESTNYFESLQRQIARLGISNRVFFLPPVYGDEKWAMLADADILALVSHYESWGIVAAEAVVSGVPVLITDSCGFAGVMKNCGGLVVKKNVEAIRDGLQRLMSDKAFYAGCKSQLAVLAGELTWAAAIEKLANHFEKWNNRNMKKL